MKKTFNTVYAVFSTVLLVVGFLIVFLLAEKESPMAMLECICGLVIGFILAPTLHELGHISFAKIANMEYVYTKFFCFKIYIKNGKKRLAFASPFEAEETQVIPKVGGNMERRACLYVIGGLVFGGGFLGIILLAAILCSCLGGTNYLLWGIVPYSAYLLFLNLFSAEYAGGKTDMLIYRGLKKGEDAEKNMIAAMEIQGRLYEGKSYSEIQEDFYFNVPQLREDEPLFAVMLDLRYRYYLEKEEFEKAADCLNRLVMTQPYLSETEMEKVLAELVYMHSLNGDVVNAEETGKLCRKYLEGTSVQAKRTLAAFSLASGNEEGVQILLGQAEEALQKEWILGVVKAEKILLSRMKKYKNVSESEN